MQQVQEALAVADAMTDPVAQRHMLFIAEAYRCLAQRSKEAPTAVETHRGQVADAVLRVGVRQGTEAQPSAKGRPIANPAWQVCPHMTRGGMFRCGPDALVRKTL